MKALVPALLLSFPVVAGAASTLTSGLVVYYDFEETGAAGLANKAPGASTYNATRNGGGAFDSSANPSGSGFSGNAAFVGADGTSNRGTALAGKSLNLVDARNDAINVGIGSAALGSSFTVSTWHYLAPGAANNSNRYHVFEASDNFDLSWGTNAVTTTTGPLANYNYLGYLNQVNSANVTATNVSTGGWHHVVQVISSDGTTSTMTVYVDGSQLTSGTITATTASVSFAGLNFGRQRSTDASDRDWDGMLDEVGIWNRALTPDEVTELRTLGLNGGSVVPEPSSALLVFSAIAFASLRRRR